jgi:hypothetical protein
MGKIAIIHSGTSGNPADQIKAFRKGAKSVNSSVTFDNERYADDGDPSSLFDDAIKNGADVLVAAAERRAPTKR